MRLKVQPNCPKPHHEEILSIVARKPYAQLHHYESSGAVFLPHNCFIISIRTSSHVVSIYIYCTICYYYSVIVF